MSFFPAVDFLRVNLALVDMIFAEEADGSMELYNGSNKNSNLELLGIGKDSEGDLSWMSFGIPLANRATTT